MGQKVASLCCHIEPLPAAKLEVATAPIVGPQPAVQPESNLAHGYDAFDCEEGAGQGEYVSELESRVTGLRYVCYRIPKAAAPRPHSPEQLREHFSVLCNLEHPHACKVVEVFESDDEHILVYEKACSPPLLEFIAARNEGSSRVEETEASELLRQMLSALHHAHHRGVIHGRLGPGSFLLAAPDGGGPKRGRPAQVKICGIGLGHVLLPINGQVEQRPLRTGEADPPVPEVSRIEFAAPESLWAVDPAHTEPPVDSPESAFRSRPPPEKTAVMDHPAEHTAARYAQKALIDSCGRSLLDRVDIWACGVMAYHLLLGRAPFASHGKRDPAHLLASLKTDGINLTKANKALSSDAREILHELLKLSPGLRPSAAALLRRPWLKLTRHAAPWEVLRPLYRSAVLNLREGQFKKLVARVVAEQLPKDDGHLEDVLATFVALDKDRDEVLNLDEFLLGLQKFPELDAFVVHPVTLFEAMDRNASGCLNAKEFAAGTLPPEKLRDPRCLWRAFQTFDRNGDGFITVDEVIEVARLLEGSLLAAEQLEEFEVVLEEELTSIGMAPTAEDAEVDNLEGVWRLFGPCVRKYRAVDFEEFFYLCAVRPEKGFFAIDKRSGIVTACQKEAYRFLNAVADTDLHNVRGHDETLVWPPGDPTATPQVLSVHQARGGLSGDHRRPPTGEKERKKKSKQSRAAKSSRKQ